MLLYLLTFGYFGGEVSHTPPPPKSPFLRLPREIRDLVYQHVFETDSKFVSLKPPIHPGTKSAQLRLCNHSLENPTSRQTQIDLSLLQVCKDINQECKDFIWRRKTVVLAPTDACVRSRCFQNVQHARLELDLGCGTYPAWTRECFGYLEEWAKAGTLKSLDIIVVHNRENLLCVAEVREAEKIGWVSCRNIRRKEVIGLWDQYMAILKEYGNNAGEPKLGGVATRVSVDVGWNDRFFTRSQKETLLGFAGVENVQGMIRDLHAAMGGALWQDGVLCWEENVQVAEAFQVKEGDRNTL